MTRTPAFTLSAALAAWVLAVPVCQAAAGTAAGASRIVLENGMEVVALPRPGVPLVTAVTVVRAGLSRETPPINGVSHMLEHLLFNGTTSRTQERLYEDLDAHGIIHNAHTDVDATTLFMLGPRESIPAMLELQADMLFRSIFPEEKLEKERGIVLNEIARDAARPGSAIEDFVSETLYAGTPCAMGVAGSEGSIRGLTRGAILAYHEAFYVPSNMTLLVTGDLDPAAVLEAARAAFGPIRPGAAPPPAETAPCAVTASGGSLHTRRFQAGSRRVVLAASGPALAEPLADPASLLVTLVSPGLAEALNAGLPEAGGKFLEVSAGTVARQGGGHVQIDATIDATLDWEVAARALRREIGRRLAEPIDAEALGTLKVAERVRLAILEEKPHYFGIDRAPRLACCGWKGVAEAAERVAAVTPMDVARAASLWAAPEAWVTIYAGDDAPSLTAPGPAPAAPSAPAAAAPAGPAPAAEEARIVLPNGLTLRLRSVPGSGVFAANVLARDRSASEPAGKEGIADLLHRLAGNATASRDAATLQKDLSRIGATLKVTDDPMIPYDDADTNPEYSFLRIETIDEFSGAALGLLAEMIREPSFDEPSFVRQKGLQTERAKQGADRPSEKARTRMLQSILGSGHPLTRPPFGTPESLASIRREELAAFRDAYFAPANLILAVLTSRPLAEIREEAIRLFGALPASTTAKRKAPEPIRPAAATSHREPSGGPQAFLLLGSWIAPPDGEVPALAAAASVLSRRMSFELREKRGLAYSLGAGVEPLGEGLLVTVRMGTRHEQVAAASAGIEEMLREIVEKPPDAEEIATAVRLEGVRVMMRSLSRINQAAKACVDELRTGTPGAALWRSFEQPDPGEVAAAAKKYLAARKMTRVVLE